MREIYLYTICTSTAARFGGVGVARVDEAYCPTALLYQSGPVTIVNCTAGNRWTTLETPPIPVSGWFTVELTWGARVNGTSNPQFALDEEYADALCQRGEFGFPGCATSQASCSDWVMQASRSFIYVTDIDHDGTLDDICARYGAAYPIDINIPYGYAAWANNLLLGVGLQCTGSTATEPSTWGRVKALFR